LQCVAVCCSVLQCVAVCCTHITAWTTPYASLLVVCALLLQCVAVCCSVLQCAAVCCSILLTARTTPYATPCNTLHHTATHCNTFCNTLQHTATQSATHCNRKCLPPGPRHMLRFAPPHSTWRVDRDILGVYTESPHCNTHYNTLCSTLCDTHCTTYCNTHCNAALNLACR